MTTILARDEEHKVICAHLRVAFESQDQARISAVLGELETWRSNNAT